MNAEESLNQCFHNMCNNKKCCECGKTIGEAGKIYTAGSICTCTEPCPHTNKECSWNCGNTDFAHSCVEARCSPKEGSMTPGRMPSNNNTTSHTKCECWDNHKNADVTEGSCGCCATHRHTNQTGWEANISLEEQVKRLADFILKNHADKITGGGAIETAIQIIQLLSKEREEGKREAAQLIKRMRPYLNDHSGITVQNAIFIQPEQALRNAADAIEEEKALIKEVDGFLAALTHQQPKI